jgi:hypothetical protein
VLPSPIPTDGLRHVLTMARRLQTLLETIRESGSLWSGSEADAAENGLVQMDVAQ